MTFFPKLLKQWYRSQKEHLVIQFPPLYFLFPSSQTPLLQSPLPLLILLLLSISEIVLSCLSASLCVGVMSENERVVLG